VTPDELRQLREELHCTARELAATLGIDSGEVTAWEQGELFPTKKVVLALTKLRSLGPVAVTRKLKRRSPIPVKGAARLADPEFWQLVRKLVEHPELFDKVRQIADAFPDPAQSSALTP
jgi:transcriptional regulator with XRE-family HTH domain